MRAPGDKLAVAKLLAERSPAGGHLDDQAVHLFADLPDIFFPVGDSPAR